MANKGVEKSQEIIKRRLQVLADMVEERKESPTGLEEGEESEEESEATNEFE